MHCANIDATVSSANIQISPPYASSISLTQNTRQSFSIQKENQRVEQKGSKATRKLPFPEAAVGRTTWKCIVLEELRDNLQPALVTGSRKALTDGPVVAKVNSKEKRRDSLEQDKLTRLRRVQITL